MGSTSNRSRPARPAAPRATAHAGWTARQRRLMLDAKVARGRPSGHGNLVANRRLWRLISQGWIKLSLDPAET